MGPRKFDVCIRILPHSYLIVRAGKKCGKGGNKRDLPPALKECTEKKGFTLRLSSTSLPLAEASLIRKVLEETNWNLKQTALELDIARGTLYSKMKKYGIERPE